MNERAGQQKQALGLLWARIRSSQRWKTLARGGGGRKPINLSATQSQLHQMHAQEETQHEFQEDRPGPGILISRASANLTAVKQRDPALLRAAAEEAVSLGPRTQPNVLKTRPCHESQGGFVPHTTSEERDTVAVADMMAERPASGRGSNRTESCRTSQSSVASRGSDREGTVSRGAVSQSVKADTLQEVFVSMDEKGRGKEPAANRDGIEALCSVRTRLGLPTQVDPSTVEGALESICQAIETGPQDKTK